MTNEAIRVELIQEGVNDAFAQVKIFKGKTLLKVIKAEVKGITGADNKRYPAVHLEEKKN
ncbi:MAG: hypothetical protein Q8O83_02805 [bacterium]|nr:hypothetical protein [bacterium]